MELVSKHDHTLLPALPMTTDLIDQFSHLTHVTNIDFAELILKDRRIFGKDKLGHANFGLKCAIRADIADQRGVILYFAWKGTNAVLDYTYFGDYDLWDAPPKPNVAYHIKTQTSILEGYWQTNIYGCSSGLKFIEAKPYPIILPRFKLLFRVLPDRLYCLIDKAFSYQQTVNDRIKRINKLSGIEIEV